MAKNKKAKVTVADALDQLAAMEQRCVDWEDRIPDTTIKQEDWQGLAFVIDGVKVISAMDEVRELLPYQHNITPVPGTQSWMLGLANIRGELLPIMDLQHFMGAAPLVPSDATRILVIRHRGMSTGLAVPSVIGMRNFPISNRAANSVLEGALGVFVYDSFKLEDGTWPVFSMAGLVNDPRFMNAAA
ncbi:MAG: chemotaxis protein CheW [bacterium]